MRFRVIGVTTITVVAYIAAAFLWRQVFPFRDGIAEFLPEQTIAYAHVNLTPAMRRDLLRWGNSFIFSPPPSSRRGSGRGWTMDDTLMTAIRSPDVQELAFVSFQPEQHEPTVAVIIGQRASERPDVVPTETFDVGGQEIRILVVRVRGEIVTSSSSRGRGGSVLAMAEAGHRPWSQPIQAFLRPQLLPIPALDAARHLLPEVLTAAGTTGRRGFILRSDGRIPLVLRTVRTPLLVGAQPGRLQVIGLPIRAIAAQLDLPFHAELRAAIEPSLPDLVDLLLAGGRIAIRMGEPAVSPPDVTIRSLAARIWPSARTRRLDGLPATVQVADPSEFEVIPTGENRWVLRQRGTDSAVVTVERRDGQILLSTDASLLNELGDSPEHDVALPGRCRFGDGAVFAVWLPYPHLIVSVGLDQAWSEFAVCGRSL